MAQRTTADDTFEPMVFAVGFQSTRKAGSFRCVVVATTALTAIDQADNLIRISHGRDYAIMSVEPVVSMGISEVED